MDDAIFAIYRGAGVTLEQPASQPASLMVQPGARPWAVAGAANRKPVIL